MKKLIYLLILVCSLVVVGCSASDEGSDSGEDAKKKVVENSSQGVTPEKVEVDASEFSDMEGILVPAFKMMADGTTYAELFEGENLSWLAYSIILDRDLHNSPDVVLNETTLVMDKNDMNMYLKALNKDFDNRKIAEIETDGVKTLEFFFEADAYSAMPADGGGTAEVEFVKAYDNGDGTFTAEAEVQMVYDDGEEQPVESYSVTMVKNEDGNAKYAYSVVDID